MCVFPLQNIDSFDFYGACRQLSIISGQTWIVYVFPAQRGVLDAAAAASPGSWLKNAGSWAPPRTSGIRICTLTGYPWGGLRTSC